MATEDISRALSQPRKHYVAARLQQGRILLDSDFNEGTDLADEEQRRTALDLLGPEATGDAGFSIGKPFKDPTTPDDQTEALRTGDEVAPAPVQLTQPPPAGRLTGALAPTLIHPVTVRAGSLYLGGLRFDEEKAEHIAFQRDFLQATGASFPPLDANNPVARSLYYLNTWEQAVGAVEDPEIGEAMLEGPDTSVRIRRMRRVEIFDTRGLQNITSDEAAFQALLATLPNSFFNGETSQLESLGRLRIVFKDGQSSDTCGPCAPSLQRFLGDENIALRVMQTDTSHYVWSLTNAAPLFRVTVQGLDAQNATTLTITMLTPPQDETQLPLKNQVIELLPFGALLDGGNLPAASRTPHSRKVAAEVGALTRAATSFDRRTQSFTVEVGASFANAVRGFVRQWDPSHPDAAVLNDPLAPPGGTTAFYMRLWHVAPTAAEIELPLNTNPNGAALGDTGVVPLFVNPGRRGDFWVATLRTDRPGVVVPFDLGTTATGVPPHGPRRFIQRLALVDLRAETVQEPQPHVTSFVDETSDTRPRIRRVTDDTCIDATVGDGVNSIGDYLSIQAAINAMPSQGGRIAVHPGFYSEQIRIDGRRNISIEGCGDATVLETPRQARTGQVVRVSRSTGITLSGLSINAVDQVALLVTDSADVGISSLAVTAGIVDTDDRFSPAARAAGVALVDIQRTSSLTLRGLILEGFQRPALRLEACQVVTVRDLSALGNKTLGPQPVAPLVSIVSSALVKVSDSRLQAFGQVALDVSGARTQDVELSDLTIEVASFETPDLVLDSRSGLDIETGERIRIERCRVSMEASLTDDAAVVVRGNDVVIAGNRLEAARNLAANDDLAWGGLQIRGGSVRVQVLKNHILGGIGHGITLGSVLWRPNSSPIHSPKGSPRGKAVRREGAGRGQIANQTGVVAQNDPKNVLNADIGAGFTDEDGHDFSPVAEGSIADLIIAGNRIEEMRSNGISVITLLGLRDLGGDLIEVERARIERNVIVGNVKAPGFSLPIDTEIFPFPASREGAGVPIPTLAFGGIVLGAASGGIDIRDNVITGNGSSSTVPISGIFILTGDAVSITGNRIADNGALAQSPSNSATNSLRPGVRAGIGVMLAGVTGGALDEVSPVLSGRVLPDPIGSSLRVIGNSVVQNEGRALHAVATGPVTVDGNFLLSRGYHGAETINDRFAIGDVVFLQNLGTPWEQFDIAAVASRDLDEGGRNSDFADFIAPQGTQNFLLNTSPPGPRRFAGEGGAVLFSNNHVTYDWAIRRTPPPTSAAPLCFFPVAILGLDHVGATGNHLGLRLDVSQLSQIQLADLDRRRALPVVTDKELVLSHLFAIGTTVDVNTNRCASGFHFEPALGQVPDAVLSILTFAETLSTLALNATTHSFLGFTARTPSSILGSGLPADDPSTLSDREEEGNLVLLPKSDLNSVTKAVKRIQEEFMKLISTGSPQDSTDLAIVTLQPADNFREHQIIAANGRNFGVSKANTQITIGTVGVSPADIDFANSTDSQVIFRVPTIPNLSPQGTLLALTISNRETSDAVVRRFFPLVQPVAGNVFVEFVGATPPDLTPGQSMLFKFSIRADTDQRASFVITAVTNPNNFRPTLLDSSRASLPGNAITLDPTGTDTFFVQVDPPDDTSGAFFTLAVAALAEPVRGSTGLLGFTTGSTVTPPDNTITLDVTAQNLGPGVTFDGATITSAANGRATFTLTLRFATPVTDYSVAVEQQGGATGWGASVNQGLPTGPLPANTNLAVGFRIVVASIATSGFIEFSVLNTQGAKVKSVLFAAQFTPTP